MAQLFTTSPDVATVTSAKNWLRAHAERGAICPCCKQYVKIYRRALGTQMARWLIWLVRSWEHTPMHWIDVKESPVRGGDYAKLLHWGLVEQKQPSRDSDTKDTGLWRPTHLGIDFVMRRTRVPSHVYIYNNNRLKFEAHTVDIVEALGKRFSYKELMNAPVQVRV